MRNNTDVSIYKKCKDSPVAWFYFVVGLVATIAIRAIGVFHFLGPLFSKILWYIGIVGFFLYFIYKYKVETNRRKYIFKSNLLEKLSIGAELNKEDIEFLNSIICSSLSKKDAINYFVIFFTSGIGLLIALFFDLRIIK